MSHYFGDFEKEYQIKTLDRTNPLNKKVRKSISFQKHVYIPP